MKTSETAINKMPPIMAPNVGRAKPALGNSTTGVGVAFGPGVLVGPGVGVEVGPGQEQSVSPVQSLLRQ
jgi:hypothetical protein